MLVGFDTFLGGHIALAQWWQQGAVLVVAILLLVAAFLVNCKETRELHDLARRAKFMAPRAVAQRDAGAFDRCRGHLAGDCPLPDQLIKPRFIARTIVIAPEIDRPDCFVCFLSILGLSFVMTWFFGNEMAGITVIDRLARGLNGTRVHLHAVSTHVGNRARLIERLRHPHGMAGREPQLARRLLLEGRGGERRIGIAAGRLGLDLLDPEGPTLNRSPGPQGNAFIAKAQAIQLLPFKLYQPCRELGAALLQLGDDRPVFLRPEQFDLALTLTDQAQRH